ncbi:MAG: hypothetical protein AB8G86_07805 [Saprospiraceae bacterium]
MLIRNNNFFAPYYIFIKKGNKLKEREFFERLELFDYNLTSDDWKSDDKILLDGKKRYLFLTESENWTHLMDDWMYTLWHDTNFKSNVTKLSKYFDIYCCSVGDVDESFDFKYFESGRLKREYIVEDPKFRGGEITKNFGIPFIGEEIALNKKEPLDKVLSIAKLVGINIEHQLDKIKCYARLERESEAFFFNKNEY